MTRNGYYILGQKEVLGNRPSNDSCDVGDYRISCLNGKSLWNVK